MVRNGRNRISSPTRSALQGLTPLPCRNDLPSALLSAIQTGLADVDADAGRILVNRSLRFLKASAKALAANRMPKGRANMMRFAEILFSPLRQVHTELLQRAVQGLQAETGSGQEGSSEIWESALLAFRTLRFLVMYGFRDPNLAGEPTVRSCSPSCVRTNLKGSRSRRNRSFTGRPCRSSLNSSTCACPSFNRATRPSPPLPFPSSPSTSSPTVT